MYDKNLDPIPKITEELRKELLSGERRLKMIDKLRERKIVEKLDHNPPCYLVNLNHYGGQAFINMKGELVGFVAEYDESSEINDKDRMVIDQKLAHLHPQFFFTPMNDDQRRRGMQMLAKESGEIAVDTPVIVNVRFPDGDMIQINYKTGRVDRFYHTCIWAYECPDEELPVLLAYQIDTQMKMSFDLVNNFTTDKYNKLFKYQSEVSEHWKRVRKKIFSSLPKDYWKQWEPRNSRNPLSEKKK